MRLINRAPIPALFIVAFVWGASFPATQRLLDDMSTRQALTARFGLAWILMVLADRFSGRTRGASASEGLGAVDSQMESTASSAPAAGVGVRAVASAWGPAIISGVLLLVVFWMEIEALARTTVSSVAVLLAATTVVTAIVERITGGARLSNMTVIAGVAVIVGTLLMSAGPRGFGLGEALALGSNVPRALQMAVSRRIVRPDGRDEAALQRAPASGGGSTRGAASGGARGAVGGSASGAASGNADTWLQRLAAVARIGPQRTPAALTRFQFFVVAIGGVALTLAEGDLPVLPHSLGGWGALVFLTAACTIGAFVTITAALVHVSASVATLVLSTEPVWGVVLGVALLGERMGVAGAIGAALIVSSAILGSVGQQRG